MTSCPASASARAAASPITPAPITTASTSSTAAPLLRAAHRQPKPGAAARWGFSRLPPVQAREARIIAVERNPFGARLDCKRRERSVADEWAARIGFDAETLEDAPVSAARLNNLAMGLTEQVA